MRARAGLHTDDARRQIREERQHLGPSEALANDRRAALRDAVHLKDILGKIKADRGNLHGGRSLSLWRSSVTTTLWHIDAVEQGASTPSREP